MPHPFVCVGQISIYYTGEIRGVREPLKAMFPASVNVGAQITSGGEVVILNPPNPYAQSNDKYPRKYPPKVILRVGEIGWMLFTLQPFSAERFELGGDFPRSKLFRGTFKFSLSP